MVPKPFFLKVFSITLLVCTGISACASLPRGPDIEGAQFTVQGRMGVRSALDNFSSSFSWTHAGDDFRIELWGPLGQGRTRLVGSAAEVVVYSPDGEVSVEPDSAQAMQRWLGFSVPIEALTRWIQGYAALGHPATRLQRDATGDLMRVEQLDWQLVFSRYRVADEGRRVPGKIVATKGEVAVTLIPKQWTFLSSNQ